VNVLSLDRSRVQRLRESRQEQASQECYQCVDTPAGRICWLDDDPECTWLDEDGNDYRVVDIGEILAASR
jgi:hypothetical protein